MDIPETKQYIHNISYSDWELRRIFCQWANGPIPRKTMGHFQTKWDIDRLIFHLNCIMANDDLNGSKVEWSKSKICLCHFGKVEYI